MSVAKRQKKPKGSKVWLVCLAAMMVAVLAPYSAFSCAVVLLPAAMAWIADREPGRPTARVVLLFGLAAACAPFDMLWHANHGSAGPPALILAVDVKTLAVAWAAEAGGWLLTQLLPLLIGAWAEAQTQAQIKAIAVRKINLLQEWTDTPSIGQRPTP